ncbi:Phenylacetic acid catabolic protein [Hwanghaeella sp. LZ110]|uniref:Phenylacetic acid catabolic protein n=1 Tax=Hwanghaeella sp. LZ110 TaxID=3402810 RepID=UPI000C8F5D08|nr:hypothetical protein [Rhodospirillaceae bacterium]|tara:strand:+ start:975 stop:1736 length:762 start_codon:yes stop_codon:yes gene_type:complete
MQNQVFGEAGIGNVTLDNFLSQDQEFQELQLNLIAIHVVSEEVGADKFEESILRAPDPNNKMRMAKTVMEEYGHHIRYRELLDELGLDWREVCAEKAHLTTFDTPIDTWADQMAFLALVDRAAAHQFRHFIKSPYQPFREASQKTLNEEYGHVGFGMDGIKEFLTRGEEGAKIVRHTVWKWLPVAIASFGSDQSATNDRLRYWGIKTQTNREMKQAYYDQVRAFITKDWGTDIPDSFDAFLEAADNRQETAAA